MKSTELLLLRPMMPLVTDTLDRLFTLHRGDLAQDKEEVLAELGPRIRGMAVSHVQVDGALLDRLPNLEIVANFGVGYDTIDAAECGRRGVTVTNTPDVLTDEVADLALGLLLATLRQIPQSDRYLRQGRWLDKPFPLTGTLRGRKVGILGLGRIGRAVAHRLVAFGAPVAYHGRRRQDDVPYEYHPTLLGLAKAVDVLIVVAPGGPETRNIVDREVLAALGPEGVLVNVARGTLVDEDALAAALADGTIQSAGLDVFADEPRVPQALIAQEHTVLLPHVGSASTHTRNAMGQLVIDNLVSWFSGKGPVTPVAETPILKSSLPRA
ncbi:2-hydroxyacid dehydrogenase [uncultured Methylobacterium sp.]|uniref:2-hydroxyacid dehydrogenase n=1 Tax=uncultured Methylobacterium sp. TaxID=157278 RepID=UPI002601AF15|nr:2-hydroxyacid dehydrogenase [uncultured Methylobacterium sp.]